MKKGKIVFSRKACLRGIATKYILLLDGKEVGRLGNGQTIPFPVEKGHHTLTLKPHPSFLMQTFGPYDLEVGSQDVTVWVDMQKEPIVCKITGSENDSKLPQMAEHMCRKLLDATAAVAGERLPCYYVMQSKQVTLKAVSGGKILDRLSYGELSDYAVTQLERWQQVELAKALGVEISLSGRLPQASVSVAGACVNLDPK